MLFRTFLLKLSVCILVGSFAQVACAEKLTWSFPMDEQSIKNGPESDGSTNSPGLGQGVVELDLDTNIISIDLSWSGLIGDLTKLHIHGPASLDGSNPQHLIEIYGPPEVPAELATTEGSWSDTFELQTLLQPNFDPVDPDLIIESMINGQAYVNVHTTVFGTGEIRGNLGLPVPEPRAQSLLVCGLLGGVCLRRNRRRTC